MQFSVYIPGTVSLPVLHLGAESLTDREVVVRSLQPERGSELAEPRSQILLPGTQTALWLVSAVLLLLPVLWMLLARFGSRWLGSLRGYLTAILPYRRLRGGLRRLAKRIEDSPAKQFYIDLLQLLRQYFSEKTGQDCMSATTHELSRILELLSDDPAVLQDLKEVFRFGDMVKFAGTQAPVAVRSQHLIKVCRVTASIEAREPDIPQQVMPYVHS